MLQDSKGNRLYRRLEIKIVYPDSILDPETTVQKAPAGKGFSDENINSALMSIADRLDSLYPFWEFEPIELASHGRLAKFVFAFKGYRAAQTPSDNPTEQTSSAPASEVAAIPEASSREVPMEATSDAAGVIPADRQLILSPEDPRTQAAA